MSRRDPEPPAADVRGLLAWRGGAYGGWQLQPNAPTVQGEVEAVLQRIMNGGRVPVQAAGRLDAGVHACEQVIRFRVQGARRTPLALFRGLNGLLPPDIACLAMSATTPDFDPRRQSRGKTYRYRMLLREAPCPFRATDCWHVARPVNLDAMRAAADTLVGLFDFTSFQATGCAAEHPMRRVRSIQVEDRHDEVHIVVDGEAFLRHQVRIMAGCLLEVGRGRKSVQWLIDVREARDRNVAARTAPAHGLWLERVHFHPPLQWTHGGPALPQWDGAPQPLFGLEDPEPLASAR